MAMTDLGGELLWPRPFHPLGVLRLDAQYNLLGGTTKVAYVFRAPKTGTLDQIEWLMGSPFNNQPMRVSFQSLTGNAPNGTASQYRTYAPTGGWKTPGLMTSDGTDSGTKRSVTKNDWLAAVFEWTGSAGDVYFTHGQEFHIGAGNYSVNCNADCYWLNFSGSWGAYTNPFNMIFALKYNDGTYGRVLGSVVPASSVAQEDFSSSSSPDERGLKFDLAVSMRACGVWALLDVDAAADVVIYDTNGSTVLTTTSLPTLRSSDKPSPVWVRFTTDLTLAVGTGYRLVVKPTTTSTVGLSVFTLNSGAMREAFPAGLTAQYTGRTDAGAWTDTATKVANLALIVNGMDAAAGGGGGSSEQAVAYVG